MNADPDDVDDVDDVDVENLEWHPTSEQFRAYLRRELVLAEEALRLAPSRSAAIRLGMLRAAVQRCSSASR